MHLFNWISSHTVKQSSNSQEKKGNILVCLVMLTNYDIAWHYYLKTICKRNLPLFSCQISPFHIKEKVFCFYKSSGYSNFLSFLLYKKIFHLARNTNDLCNNPLVLVAKMTCILWSLGTSVMLWVHHTKKKKESKGRCPILWLLQFWFT